MVGNSNEQRIKESPKSREAEQAVLGALLLDNSRWDDVVDHVIDKDFFYQENQLIFKAFSSLSDRGASFDILTVTAELNKFNQLSDAGGDEYLRKIAMETPSTTNIIDYAKIIREEAIKRRLIAASGDIANSAFFPDGRDAQKILEEAEQKVFKIAEEFENKTREGFVSARQTTASVIEEINLRAMNDSEITGISTGFSDLDKMTSGMQRGDLLIVAGRPSMGKTTFAMNIAESVAIQSKLPVAIFSLEMPAKSLVMRMIASIGGIENSRLRTGKLTTQDGHALKLAVSNLSQSQLFIDDGSNISGTDLRARVRRLKRDQGELGLVLIDYIQLMQMPDGNDANRATQIGDISRNLKLLAKEMDVPVIALSQLNRSLENRPDKRPIMSDIRESGAIEQDADVIMFVYRDIVYNDSADPNKAEIIIGKQRNGPIGKVDLKFEGVFTRFNDYIPQEEGYIDYDD